MQPQTIVDDFAVPPVVSFFDFSVVYLLIIITIITTITDAPSVFYII